MSGEVPRGWTRTCLDAVASNVSDKWEPSEGAQAYIGLEHIDQGSGNLLGRGDTSQLQSIKTHFRPGDTLFGKLRPNLRKTALVDFPGVASTDILVIRPSRKLFPEFLFYRLSSEDVFDHAIRSSAGTKMPRTSWKEIGEFEFPLPPLPEQRRIAEILSSVDEAIAATRAVIEQTRKVKQAVLERLLTKGIGHTRFKQTEIGEIPEGWEVKSVDELCVLSNGNGFRPPDWSDTGLPIIRIQNLNGSKIFNYFNGTPLEKWLINPGDLLFAWAGVRGVSFGPTIWPGPLGVLNQHIFKICCRENVDKLWFFLTLKLITSKIEQKAHGFKDSLLHVHKKEITRQQVALPPFAEQVKISRRAAELQAAEDASQMALESLMSLKSALMSDLLTGRKRVTDALPLAAE